MRYIFDVETNGLLDKLNIIHCLVIEDIDSGQVFSYDPTNINVGISKLEQAEELIGHNILGFDMKAIQIVYPEFSTKAKLIDTLLMSRMLYTDLRDRDFKLRRRETSYPTKLIGSHGLEAWGRRLGEHKGDYKAEMEAKNLDPWEAWNPVMQTYCEQDVTVNRKLYELFLTKGLPDDALDLETKVAGIIQRQTDYGIEIDIEGAQKLYGLLLSKKVELETQLAELVPPWEVRTPFVPKRDNKRLGYKKGETFYKVTEVIFNPGSRDHIARHLIEKYKWQPKEFTPEGKPKIDETVLSSLKFPEASMLSEYFLITKRLGMVGEGRYSWLKMERKGRIHGRVNTLGAVTGRMTHSSPNMAQVPSGRAPYGEQCRALFRARPGYKMVGCDADGLELRCLAHYMAAYDGGTYIETVDKGRKEEQTDMHTLNSIVLQCDRDTAKTFFYAFVYGAGDAKLGAILGKGRTHGRDARQRFLRSLPALNKLINGVKRKSVSQGYITGIDGRELHIRSEHAALNTLLQSAGALLMKRALVILDDDLRDRGLTSGTDWEFVANIHDEFQIEVRTEHAQTIGERAVAALEAAGNYYEFQCPITGEFQCGDNWSETH